MRELLAGVGLSDAARRPAGTYSGGMQRRLGIAQAIIHSPRLLVVDEPTAGLDPEERIRFRGLVSEVAENTAVLLSTHIVEDVEATCPRLAVIGRGRLLFDGSPTELLRRAAGRLWRVPAGVPLPAGAAGGELPGRPPGGRGAGRLFRGAGPGASLARSGWRRPTRAFLALQGVEIDRRRRRREADRGLRRPRAAHPGAVAPLPDGAGPLRARRARCRRC